VPSDAEQVDDEWQLDDHDCIAGGPCGGVDALGDGRVRDGLEATQLGRVGEHHACEEATIDRTVAHHRRPASRNGIERLASGLEDRMAEAVGLDHVRPLVTKQAANETLTAAERTREHDAAHCGILRRKHDFTVLWSRESL
jgi:hypothetical protein